MVSLARSLASSRLAWFTLVFVAACGAAPAPTAARVERVAAEPGLECRPGSSADRPEPIIETGHSGAVDEVAISNAGRIATYSSKDKIVRIWDARQAKLLSRFELPVTGRVAEKEDARRYVADVQKVQDLYSFSERSAAGIRADSVFGWKGDNLTVLQRDPSTTDGRRIVEERDALGRKVASEPIDKAAACSDGSCAFMETDKDGKSYLRLSGAGTRQSLFFRQEAPHPALLADPEATRRLHGSAALAPIVTNVSYISTLVPRTSNDAIAATGYTANYEDYVLAWEKTGGDAARRTWRTWTSAVVDKHGPAGHPGITIDNTAAIGQRGAVFVCSPDEQASTARLCAMEWSSPRPEPLDRELPRTVAWTDGASSATAYAVMAGSIRAWSLPGAKPLWSNAEVWADLPKGIRLRGTYQSFKEEPIVALRDEVVEIAPSPDKKWLALRTPLYAYRTPNRAIMPHTVTRIFDATNGRRITDVPGRLTAYSPDGAFAVAIDSDRGITAYSTSDWHRLGTMGDAAPPEIGLDLRFTSDDEIDVDASTTRYRWNLATLRHERLGRTKPAAQKKDKPSHPVAEVLVTHDKRALGAAELIGADDGAPVAGVTTTLGSVEATGDLRGVVATRSLQWLASAISTCIGDYADVPNPTALDLKVSIEVDARASSMPVGVRVTGLPDEAIGSRTCILDWLSVSPYEIPPRRSGGLSAAYRVKVAGKRARIALPLPPSPDTKGEGVEERARLANEAGRRFARHKDSTKPPRVATVLLDLDSKSVTLLEQPVPVGNTNQVFLGSDLLVDRGSRIDRYDARGRRASSSPAPPGSLLTAVSANKARFVTRDGTKKLAVWRTSDVAVERTVVVPDACPTNIEAHQVGKADPLSTVIPISDSGDVACLLSTGAIHFAPASGESHSTVLAVRTRGIAINPSGTRVAALGEDGAVRLFATNTGALLATLFAFEDGEQIAFSPAGAYAGTREVAERIAWRFEAPTEAFAFAQFARTFDRPDIVMSRLRDGRAEVDARITRPPHVRIADHRVAGRAGKISVETQGGPVRVRAFREGREVGAAVTKSGTASLDVPLLAGKNRLTVVAYDGCGVASNEAVIDLDGPDDGPRPALWTVAVGVSRYPRLAERFQLDFADDDARGVVNALGNHGSTWREVHSKLLVDESASPTAIRAALTDLQQMGPDDLAVVFLAGHGIKLPGDDASVFLTGGATLDPAEARKSSIGWTELSTLLARARGRVLVVLDACHSGHVANDVVQNDALAGELQKEGRGGFLVFAAAKGRQLSYEPSGTRGLDLDGDPEGKRAVSAVEPHGYFTGALLTSLRTADTDVDRNGRIEVRELIDAVSRRVRRATDGLQTPWVARTEIVGDFGLTNVPR